MEKEITIAAQLYKCRESAKFLLGNKYDERMAAYGEAIRDLSEELKCGEIEAATRMAKLQSDGMAQMIILAAAVELLEPSNAPLERAPG